MRLHWLLPGLLGALCLASPALAGNLTDWRFDPEQKQLEFTTDEGVQPRAQLLSNPARLVIDLPNTVLPQTPVNQLLSGIIRRVQVEALNAQSTRIVLELAPGYSIDPQNVRFHGLSPTQWVVQLPEPQRTDATAAPAPPPLSSTRPAPPVDSSMTQIEGIQATADGLFIRTEGARAEVRTDRSRDRRTITLSLRNAVLSPQVTAPTLTINRYGIGRVQLSQTSDNPPAVRLALEVAPNSPDWSANPSGDSGITVLPQGGIEAVANLSPPQPGSMTAATPGFASSAQTAPSRSIAPLSNPPAAQPRSTTAPASRQPIRSPGSPVRPSASRAAALLPRNGSRTVVPTAPTAPTAPAPALAAPTGSAPADNNATATIQGVELNLSNNQLMIRSDRAVAYSSRWQSGVYQIILSPAQLADRVEGPQLNASSPLLRVRLRQDDNTVVVSVQPASGVRFGALNTVSPQLLALALERSRPSPLLSPTGALSNALSSTNPRANLDRSPRSQSNQPLPQIRNGRPIVILDPGHGGSDVGAVGVNNIHEADIVLPVAQRVASILEQQGVQAILTRSSDTDVELEPRVQIAEQANADLFVSIHANSLSLDRPEVNGLETYYYNSGEALAQVIHSSILQSLGMTDRGVRSARFYVLRRTSMPSVLVEIGFVTGSEDGPHLANEGWRNQMAQSIARGILQYLQQNAGR